MQYFPLFCIYRINFKFENIYKLKIRRKQSMKKQKWAVFFAALLAMVGFSSCLNGENDPTAYPQEIMKVNGGGGYYTFTSAYGYTVTPVNMSALSGVTLDSYAIVQYSYDSSLVEWNANKDVTITNVVNIKDDKAMPMAPDADSGNAPVYAISGTMVSPTYFDRYNLFVPVTYYYKNSSDKNDLQSELNSHSFVLYYDTSESGSASGTLLLHLRHKVTDPSVQRNEYGTEYRHFNLTPVLNSYANLHNGSMPDKIVIEYEKSSSSSYENVSSDRVEIQYKSLFESTSTNNR